MSRFRKRPVIIEAIQWFKHGDHPAVLTYGESVIDQFPAYAKCGLIHTLEDADDAQQHYHHVIPSDWIITGVHGEHYACKADIFEETYEEVIN